MTREELDDLIQRAQNMDTYALAEFGNLQYHGLEGIEQDKQNGREKVLFALAAANPEAMMTWSEISEEEGNIPDAVYWRKKAANNGYPRAIDKHFRMLGDINDNAIHNADKFNWAYKLAYQGDALQYGNMCAIMLSVGIGCEEDVQKAGMLFKRRRAWEKDEEELRNVEEELASLNIPEPKIQRI